MNDLFELYDLKVSVVGDPSTFVCSHAPGTAFNVIGENLVFEKSNKVSLYSLAALIPLLPAKQRPTHSNDWMTTDEYVACPDPHCGAQFKIVRTGKRSFSHTATTKVVLL